MRILLISPCDSFFVNYSKKKKTVCVALPLLAAYTPKEYEIIVADEGYGDNVFYDNIDLVAISAMTAQALRGYEIARHYREKGVKVVMGGIHASVLPDEALQHVDAVCIGEGDSLWSEILKDTAAGKLKKIYKADELFPMEKIPPMRVDVVNRRRTTFGHTVVQASRGCPYNCEFCTTSALFGRKYRFRPVDQVIEEIKLNGGKTIFFVDDNILGSPKYCEELFEKLIPLKIRWFSQSSLLSTTRNLSLLKLARKSGCIGFFFGLESVNEASRAISTSSAKLGASSMSDISKRIKTIRDHDILVQSSVVFGIDGDDCNVFEKTVDFLKKNRVSFSSFCILTPYPGTRLHERFKKEGRLLHEDWSKYCNENVVFQPKNMTPKQLKDGSDWAGNAFYCYPSIAKRAFANRANAAVYTLINYFSRRDNLTNHGPGSIIPMDKSVKRVWLDEVTIKA